MSESRQTDESDISRILRVIRRRLWIVVLCLVVTTGAAVLLTVRAEDRYESTSGILVTGGAEPQRNAETNLQLLSLPSVAARAAEIEPEFTQEEFEASVSASQVAESDIIHVSANTSAPDDAASIANAYAEAFVAYRQEDHTKIPAGKVSLVQRAVADGTPVSPTPSKNIGFGVLIGLVLGLGLALLAEQMDRRVKREDDLADTTGLPIVATVPRRRSFDSKHFGVQPLSPAESEVFRLLRANVRYFKARGPLDAVVVTSAEAGEGKTVVALGLALAAASSGEKVLLVEADLRKPGLSRILKPTSNGGLVGLLSSDGPLDLDAAVDRVDASLLSDAVEGVRLDVLKAGDIPPNPTALIESNRMRDLLALAKQEYDFVLLDTPPVLVVADALPLISASDGVLAVSALGVSTRGSAASLVNQLKRLAIPVLGVVANFVDHPVRNYEGYAYGATKAAAAPKSSDA
jgi:capsular exopolysaccharide synthesis family protein